MNYLWKKVVNRNGQDMVLSVLELDYENGTITITGEIDDELASITNSALRGLKRNWDGDITIYVQSPGGSVSAGLSIYDTIKALNRDVITVASGLAASMGAFLVAAAGTKGKRWCQPNAEILIHQPLGGVQGQASDMKIHVEHILNTRSKVNSILAEATGQPIKKIEADTERDNIMDADTALKYGLIDRIGDPISEW